MKTLLSSILIAGVLAGCNFSKSVKKDLVSGLSARGNVLTCADVYLNINNERTTRNSFNYGEMVYLIFSDMKGFTRENGNVFPSMDIIVTGDAGDTVLQAADLYSEYTEGMNYSPLELTADLTVAAPIRSGKEYAMTVNIIDKKGPGTYSSKMNFSVRHNDQIKVETTKATVNEVYLYSEGDNKVLNDNKIRFDDTNYIIAEGLKGFTELNGLVYPGLSLKGTDSENKVIFDYDDLFSQYSESGVAESDFAGRVSSHFKLTGNQFNSPLKCEMVVWDKKGDSRIKVSASLKVE
jgi:hypothetical protein